jgi:primosomal protein N' (replication factor Y) (superfamily II helicase)
LRHIRVAVPVPALGALSYSVPDDVTPPVPGARVLVPLGTRVLTGIVVPDLIPESRSTTGSATPAGPGAEPELKPIIDVLDDAAFLPEDVVALALWIAEYYACGAGEAVAAAMPPRSWVESERYARITEVGHGRLLLERGLRRELLQQLHADEPVKVDAMLAKSRGGHAALLTLERDGLVTITRPLTGAASAFRTVRVAHLTAQGHELLEDRNGKPAADTGVASATRLGQRQRDTLALLAASPDGLEAGQLADRGGSATALKRLAELGLVTFTRRRIERDPFGHASAPVSARPAGLTLTAEQQSAVARLTTLARAGRFAAAVLYGVTGSGKTEIYLRLADDTVKAGKGVLLLVPEIALTPAVAGAFRATFGERVAIQHSGLSDGERHDQWHRIRRGDVDVVVGTRSAVFAPLRRLGVVIVDEEHDGSYKQEESPRYHGRDVAVMRAREADAVVVLGSATPSLESFHNAQTGRYELVALERRVLDRPMADVRIIDMREEYAAGGPDVVISAPLADAIRARLERNEQAMVLLNRRGFATSIFCRQCGTTLDCPNCSVTLTVHRAARRARCHYCNHAVKVPTVCADCGGKFLEQTGFGTERVEADLAALFPEARIARVDRDTIRRRGAITSLLSRFSAGEIDVLVGTQMIAKGHDFPQVTLVGVVSADVGLGMADFRAGERTFQLLTQVAGRAGRGDIAGEALVQTIHPQHYSIRHACRQDYRAFYEDERRFRESMRYPPIVALINAVVRDSTLEAAMNDAGELVTALRGGGDRYRVLGPAPAPLSRLKGEHRAQLFIKGTHRAAMRKALMAALDARPDIRRKTIIDVDPVSVL